MRFCVGLQSSLVTLDTACSQVGGMARAGADDIVAVGPAEIVFPALEELGREVQERCLLHWEKSKSEVFTWEGVLPPGTPEGVKLAGEKVENCFQPGFLLYGCPIGTSQYNTHKLQQIVVGIVEDAQQTANLLGGDRQALWSALRCSMACRFDYWLQLCYPSEVAPVARWLDCKLWAILETATGLSIPRQDCGRDWECVLPVPVQGRGGYSFQEWVVRQPVRLGGFGFRSLEETAGVAFLGALEQSVPSFPGFLGICPLLEQEMGGMNSYGEEAAQDTRWTVLLGSGCREGLELRQVWEGSAGRGARVCKVARDRGARDHQVRGGGDGEWFCQW